MLPIHMHCFGTPPLCKYSKRLPLQHFIKGYGIYINFDNFTFKVVDALYCYAQFIAFPGQRDKNLIFLTSRFSFDEVSLKSGVKLSVIIFNVKVIVVEANGARAL